MTLEVDYITLGDASARIGVPAPTLRHWTDQLEEFNVHFVLRNNRNERIYESSDIQVFEFLRDLKEEYGRRTTTRDLGDMIAKRGVEGQFKLRTREDAPPPRPSNRTTDILNQEDINRVLESERARQVLGYLVSEATKSLKEDLINDVREEVRQELKKEMGDVKGNISKSNEDVVKLMEEIKEMEKRSEERAVKRDEALMLSLRQTMDSKKGFFSKLFSK